MGDDVLRRLRFYARVQALTAGFVVALALGMSTTMVWLAVQARSEAMRQRDQIVYLCSVARVLDPIVVAARNGIKDPVTRSRFTAAHLVLSQTEPCGEVEG